MCQCDNTTTFEIDGAVLFAQGEEPDVGERVAALLFTAALLAIYIPARRVSRIDPMAVLRTEGA